jgi:peptide deformylase
MSTPTHDQFTLLYEDENTKVLHEFKGVIADDVIQHLIDFLKGCGYIEQSIYEVMRDCSQMYFDAREMQAFVMSTGLQAQQQMPDLD